MMSAIRFTPAARRKNIQLKKEQHGAPTVGLLTCPKGM
jgi:hypothetical protein